MRNILVATGGSEGRDRAVDVVAEFAKGVGGNLSIVTVGDKLFREELRQLSAAEKDAWEAVESFSKQILRRGIERVQHFGVSMAETHIGFGESAATEARNARTVHRDRRGEGPSAPRIRLH
jgi:nucleotide-binding universal stress UspA family protein